MTLIANWIGVDDNENGKLPSSLYLASDSRITFLNARNNPISTKDDVQKIFVSKKHPEMFAVCGDYNNCVSFIKHLIDEIDNDKLKLNTSPIEEKVNALKELFKAFSKDLRCDSVILYGTKVCSNLFLYRFELAVDKVDITNVPLGEKSQVISRDGSGQNDFYDKWLKFNKNAQSFNEADTSRGAFRCIYEAIEKSEDPYVGGKMQAAVLYRGREMPHPIGVYYGDKCYLFGKEYKPSGARGIIEYRNCNFEIVDPNTGKIADGAQRQPFAQR